MASAPIAFHKRKVARQSPATRTRWRRFAESLLFWTFVPILTPFVAEYKPVGSLKIQPPPGPTVTVSSGSFLRRRPPSANVRAVERPSGFRNARSASPVFVIDVNPPIRSNASAGRRFAVFNAAVIAAPVHTRLLMIAFDWWPPTAE